MRAVIYARVSTEDQAKRGYSLPSQLKECRAYAKEHDLEVVGEFPEDFTGTVPIEERPQGGKAIAVLRRKEADALVVYTIDRLARPPLEGDEWDTPNLIRSLAKLGIEIHTVDRGKIKATFVDLLIALIDSQVSGKERRSLLERSHRGIVQKAQTGKVPGNNPRLYGFRYDPALRTYAVCEHEAKIVVLIFKWYTGADGQPRLGLMQIARKLTAMGEPTPGESRGLVLKSNKPGTWGEVAVSRIVHCSAYVGRWEFHSKRYGTITVALPPIIAPALWAEAQKICAANRLYASRHSTPGRYLLRGMIKCGCGCKGSFHGWPNNQRDQLYYICTKKKSRRPQLTTPVCTEPAVKAEVLEDSAWEYIVQILSDRTKLEAWLVESVGNAAETERARTARLEDLDGQIKEAGADATRLARKAAKVTGPVAEAFDAEVAALNDRLVRLSTAREELAQANVGQNTVEVMAEMLRRRDRIVSRLSSPSRADKRRLFEESRLRITIKDGKAEIRSVFPFGATIDIRSGRQTQVNRVIIESGIQFIGDVNALFENSAKIQQEAGG